jgi:hypothetical protein
MSLLFVRLLLNGVIVGLVAWAAFNRPSWVRTYTTRRRYLAAVLANSALYILLFLLAFRIIVDVLAASGLVDAPWSPPSGPPKPANETKVTYARWAALVLTLAVIVLPWIQPRVRRVLHDLAGAPDLALHVARRLTESEFTPPPELLAELRILLQRRCIDAEEDWLPVTQPVHRQLERAVALFLQLRAWKDAGRYGWFFAEARNEYDELRQRFDRMLLGTSRALTQIQRVGELRMLYADAFEHARTPPPTPLVDALMRSLVNDQIADACEQISHFHRDACLLAARAVTASVARPARREAVFAELGFALVPTTHRSAAQAVLLGMGWIFLFLLVFFMAFGSGAPSSLPLWALVALITLTQGGALAAAIVPKMHFGFATSGLRDRTPWAFLVFAGLAAVVWSLALNTVAGALIGGLAGVHERLLRSAPYLGSPLATAVATAWLVQDHRWRTLSTPRARRWRDAEVLAAAWLAATLVSLAVKATLGMPLVGTRGPLSAPALFVFNLGFSVVMGGTLGWLVPHLARFDATARLHSAPPSAGGTHTTGPARMPTTSSGTVPVVPA